MWFDVFFIREWRTHQSMCWVLSETLLSGANFLNIWKFFSIIHFLLFSWFIISFISPSWSDFKLLSFLSYSLSLHYCLMIWGNFINYLPLFTYGHIVCFGCLKSWFSKNYFSLFSDHSFFENAYLVSCI